MKSKPLKKKNVKSKPLKKKNMTMIYFNLPWIPSTLRFSFEKGERSKQDIYCKWIAGYSEHIRKAVEIIDKQEPSIVPCRAGYEVRLMDAFEYLQHDDGSWHIHAKEDYPFELSSPI